MPKSIVHSRYTLLSSFIYSVANYVVFFVWWLTASRHCCCFTFNGSRSILYIVYTITTILDSEFYLSWVWFVIETNRFQTDRQGNKSIRWCMMENVTITCLAFLNQFNFERIVLLYMKFYSLILIIRTIYGSRGVSLAWCIYLQ